MTADGTGAPATLLEHLIRQRDATYGELAEEFESIASRIAHSASMSDRHLRRLARGAISDPTPATRRVLAVMFDRPADQLLGAYQPSDDLATTSGGSEKGALEMATERSRQFSVTATDGITDDGIEQIVEDVRDLAQAYPQHPVPSVIGKLVETQETVFNLLEQRQRPRHATDLYMLAGVVNGMLAKTCHDRSEPSAAMTHARTAYVCAERIDHHGLQAWVRGLQSLIAYWAGRPQDAVRYAQLGAEPAASRSNSSAAWLPISEARGWARLGNEAQVMACIQRADEARQHLQADDIDQLGGLCTFGPTRQAYYTADSLIWLPTQATAAEAYATTAVDAYADPTGPEWAFGDAAGARSDLAIARVRRGELDGTVEALGPVLGLSPEQRINGVVSSVRRVGDALRQSPLAPDSTAVLDQIETYTRTTIRELT